MKVLTENRAKERKKAIRERRRKLTQEHYRILDWLMCIDDNIVPGDEAEATDFINKLTSYNERLAILVGERQQKHKERLAREREVLTRV